MINGKNFFSTTINTNIPGVGNTIAGADGSIKAVDCNVHLVK